MALDTKKEWMEEGWRKIRQEGTQSLEGRSGQNGEQGQRGGDWHAALLELRTGSAGSEAAGHGAGAPC